MVYVVDIAHTLAKVNKIAYGGKNIVYCYMLGHKSIRLAGKGFLNLLVGIGGIQYFLKHVKGNLFVYAVFKGVYA